jgi:hypothetical protein
MLNYSKAALNKALVIISLQQAPDPISIRLHFFLDKQDRGRSRIYSIYTAVALPPLSRDHGNSGEPRTREIYGMVIFMKMRILLALKSRTFVIGLLMVLPIVLSFGIPRSVASEHSVNPKGAVRQQTAQGTTPAPKQPAAGGAPGISITPASFDFGTMAVGTQKSVTLTIHNTGASDLDVGWISVNAKDPSEFQFSNTTCPSLSPKINPGKSCTITVTFAPSSPGPMQTKFVVSSNAPSSPTFDVLLTATSVAAPQAQKPAPVLPIPVPKAETAPAAVQAPASRAQEPVSAGAKLPVTKPATAPSGLGPASAEVAPPSPLPTNNSLQLTADKTSPVLAATVGSVTFTAHASGQRGKNEYKFWLKGPSTGNEWKVAQDYSASASYAWIPTRAGSYVIWVYSRDASNPAEPETSSWMPFDVLDTTPVTSVTLTADKTSPALKATIGKVTFTPHAVGGSGKYEYKFWLNGPSTGNEWKVAQDYGISDSFTWTPMQAGHYLLWVYARSVGSIASREAAAWTSFDIVENPPVGSVELAANKTSPLPESAGGVVFTARASGGGGAYEYKFWLKGPSTGNVWKVAQDYSRFDSFPWKPAEAGEYFVAVYARNAGSPAGHEAIAGIPFDIAGK